jgi:hypothetical protein
MTWRADAMLAHRRRTDLPHEMIILPQLHRDEFDRT